MVPLARYATSPEMTLDQGSHRVGRVCVYILPTQSKHVVCVCVYKPVLFRIGPIIKSSTFNTYKYCQQYYLDILVYLFQLSRD
jgi:hypothetical protein